MKAYKWRVIITILSVLRLCSSQEIGARCIRQDGTRGRCRDIQECVDTNGQIENAIKLGNLCSVSFNRVIACCRKTPQIIAREKCERWKREARGDGSPCQTDIPLVKFGTEATPGEFPHMVSILTNFQGRGLVHSCGGVLVSERYVLTAAHCVRNNNFRNIFIRIGGHDHNVKEPGVDFDSAVSAVIPHEEYVHPRRYNDIALLKIKLSIGKFTSRIRPACLPYKNVRIPPGTKMIVAGWGAIENGGATSNVLRKAEVSVIERFRCDTNAAISDNINSDSYPVGITDSIICADESVAGACTGDSGGPLMVATQTSCEVKEVVGLVSRGVKECDVTTIPGTYTRVEYYLDWIVRTIWEDEL